LGYGLWLGGGAELNSRQKYNQLVENTKTLKRIMRDINTHVENGPIDGTIPYNNLYGLLLRFKCIGEGKSLKEAIEAQQKGMLGEEKKSS